MFTLAALVLLFSAAPAASQWARPSPIPKTPLVFEAELIVRGSLQAFTAPAAWDSRDWGMVAASLGAVALSSVADHDGRELMAYVRNDGNTRIEEIVEPLGAAGSLYLLGGMMGVGLITDDLQLRATAAEGLAAGLVASGIVTPTLQKVIGRAKPRDGMAPHTYDMFSGDRSLPSGHTTQAFAVAAVIASEYRHPFVQASAYGLATAVGVSRMYRRSHFLSDVVGGAIIGTVVGRAVAGFGQEWRASGQACAGSGDGDGAPGIAAIPLITPTEIGVAIFW